MRAVDDVLIVDPEARGVKWLALERGDYRSIDHGSVIDLGPAELAQGIDWL